MNDQQRYTAGLDSPERLIDSTSKLDAHELDDLLSRGWRLVGVTERVSRIGATYYRHEFRHTSAPGRGAI
jgi:hypothetical protein